MKTRYFGYTTGQDGEKIVAPNKTYAATAYATFAASNADGDFGVFKPDGTLVTAALAIGDQFFFAIKRDGTVDKSTVYTNSTELVKTKTLGTAGTNQVVTVVVSCGGTTDCIDPNSCCTDNLKNYYIGIQDPQTSDQPMRETWDYYQQGMQPKKIIDVLNTLRTKINSTTDRMNTVRGQAVVMSAVTTGGGATSADPLTYTFTLTGSTAFTKKAFKVLIKGFNVYTVTYTTPAVEPIGSLDTARQVDLEGLIRDSDWNTKYIGGGRISSEWGEPTLFSAGTASTSFTAYQFSQGRREDSNVSGIESHFRRQYMLVMVPLASGLQTTMNTIFTL